MDSVRLEAWDARDGEMTERRLRRAMEHEGFEVAVYAYRAGTAFDWHVHSEEKCDAVVEGILRVEIQAGESFNLVPGDRLYLPAGVRHRARVLGGTTVVSLDGVRR